MTNNICRRLCQCCVLFITFFLVGGVANAVTLAVTYDFTGAGGGTAGKAVSATTDFIDGAWNDAGVDQTEVATHELLHAIGFTIAYDNFSANVFDTPGAGANGIPAGSRVYSTDGTVGGILMVLTSASLGTHADPNATGAAPWPATGVNQANDIMQPFLPGGTTVGASDIAVLNHAMGWAASGIKVNVVGLQLFTAAEQAAIAAAVNAVETAFGVAAVSNFTWTLNKVPIPGAVWLFMSSLGFVIVIGRRITRRGVEE